MRFVRIRVLFLFIFVCSFAYTRAQKAAPVKQPRILILLDGSASMVDAWHEKKPRIKAAQDVIMAIMDSVYKVNKDVEFGLRVFGHQHSVTEKYCYDTKNEVTFSKDNKDQMYLRLNDIKPYGITPIAYSIMKAAEDDMVDEQKYVYSLILITDGGESCNGDICDVVKTLLEKKIYFKPYIISLFKSATLAEVYSCMGQYLQATSPAEIPKTVHTIVEAYRPMFKPGNSELRTLQNTIVSSTPSVLKVSVPTYSIKTETPAEQPVQKPVEKIIEKPIEKPVVVAKPVEKVVEKPIEKPVEKIAEKPIETPVITPLPKPVIKQLEKAIEQPKPLEIPVAKEARKKERVVAIQVIPSVATRPATPVKKPQFSKANVPDVVVRNPLPKEDMPRIATVGKPRKLSLLFTVPTFKEVALPVTTVKVVKEEEPKPVVKAEPAKPKPSVRPAIAKTQPQKPEEISYKIETEDAKETTIEILFTNGKGKFYTNTPQILVKDVVLGNTVHKFYRTLDANNRPDPQTIPAGKYNIMMAGRANSMVKNVTITANKKNRVIITLTNGSLHFQYKDNPDRPVSEYVAKVSQRSGSTEREQPCDVDIMYEPGSYHIIVNTKPLSHFYVDLDMSSITSITIPEAGFVRFSNSSKANKATLYAPLGDKFVQFMGVDLNGPADSLKVELKPGPYEVRFTGDPKVRSEMVIPFSIKSNDTTQVELK
jgi:hypothetical protein